MNPLWIIDIRDSHCNRLEECLASRIRKETGLWIYTKFPVVVPYDLDSFAATTERLLQEARAQVNILLERNCLNTVVFQICVLGDITSDQTRLLLPFVSIILKRNWAKVLPPQVGTGINVGAFVYIPTDISQQEKESRCRYAAFLQELEILHANLPAEMYDYIVPYGDVQPVGKQTYSQLDAGKLDELLFQFLVHLYDSTSPNRLLVALPGGNTLFCNMGSAAVFYDSDYIRKRIAGKVVVTLTELFRKGKEEIDYRSVLYARMQQETERLVQVEFRPENLQVEKILPEIAYHEADLTADLEGLQKNSPWHPVLDCCRPFLFPKHYLGELKYLPARLNEYLQYYRYNLRKKIAAWMEGNSVRKNQDVELLIDNVLLCFWKSEAYQYKTIAQVEEFLKRVMEMADAESKRIEYVCKTQDISPVVIPQFLQPAVVEIQGMPDTDKLNGLLDRLKVVLQTEPTFLSAVLRAALVGTSAVFCILPLLKFLSPDIVNLGEVKDYELIWILLIYMFPLIYVLWWKFGRYFKLVYKLKNRLWALMLVELKIELYVKMIHEAEQFYEQVKTNCEERLVALERIRACREEPEEQHSERFQETWFSRPIDEFLTSPSVICEQIQVGKHKTASLEMLEEDDFYRLLSQGITTLDEDLFLKIPTDSQMLSCITKQRVEKLVRFVLDRFTPNANTDIACLLNQCGHQFNWEAFTSLAYPVGIFVNHVLQDEQKIVRLSHSIKFPEELQGGIIILDEQGDNGIMYLTELIHVDTLFLSRFLGIKEGVKDLGKDLTVELTCYYAFYNETTRQSGRVGGQVVGYNRLSEIHRALSERTN